MAGIDEQNASVGHDVVREDNHARIAWSAAPSTSPVVGGEAEGSLNACFNCIDRHVRDGHGKRAALVYEAPVIDFRKTISFADLLDEVATFAAVLGDFGVVAGDRVLLFLPMIPRLPVAMLACARLGAVYVAVPADATAAALAVVLEATAPKLILVASCVVEPDRLVALKPIVDSAITIARATPEAVLVWQRPRLVATMQDGRDHDWEALIETADGAGRKADCVAVAAGDPLCILYRPDGGGAGNPVALATADTLEALARAVTVDYGLRPGDVIFAAFDAATPAGHALGVLAPLLVGAGTICFEGETVDASDAGALWRVCAEHRVAVLCADAATLQRVQAADPDASQLARHGCPDLRTIVVVGWSDPPGTAKDSLGGLSDWAARLGRPLVELRRDPTSVASSE